MAHSLIMALAATQGTEAQAFTAFHHYFPGAPLLIDTYDAIAAAHQLAAQLEAGETQLAGVRLDSGDLVSQSQQIQQILPNVPIFASGDLDEFKITELKDAGACINGYGLGTQLVTGSPVNGVYKLVEIDGIPVMKESPGKVSYPGRKQILRQYENGIVVSDRLGLMEEANASDPLLQLVMQNGQRTQPTEPIEAIAQRTTQSVATLPAATRQIHQPVYLPVEPSPDLLDLITHTQRTR
jgi:nicotinate phosphoribosyltransferase